MGKLFNLDNPVMNFLSKLADMIILNFLTIICCIPIITIGASMTAMHYVALKIVRDEECYIVKSFFKSFKQNFKQATILWLIMLGFIMVFVVDILIFKYSSMTFPDWLSVMLLAIGVVLIFGTMHIFPLLAKFDNTVAMTLKNSFLVGVMILPKTLLMMIIWVVPAAIAIYLPQILPVVIMLGVSGPGFVCALLYNKAFKRFEPEEEKAASDEEWSVPLEEEEVKTDSEKETESDSEEVSEEN